MQLSPATLANTFVRLEPFAPHHLDGLTKAAADISIFRHMPFPIAERGYGVWFDWLLAEQAVGRWIPHAVIAPTGEIVGQTCYLAIKPHDRGVEIGGTWYSSEAQGGAVNPACKYLLLEHAFACGAERVEFKTDSENAHSRAALLKLGARFEGIFRHHMLRPDGTWRDSAYYSILAEEWPDVRDKLDTRLAAFA